MVSESTSSLSRYLIRLHMYLYISKPIARKEEKKSGREREKKQTRTEKTLRTALLSIACHLIDSE